MTLCKKKSENYTRAEQKKLEALKKESAQLRTSFTNSKKSIKNLLQLEKLLAQLDLLTLRMEGISEKDARTVALQLKIMFWRKKNPRLICINCSFSIYCHDNEFMKWYFPQNNQVLYSS